MEIIMCKTDEQLKELAQKANEIWHEYFIDIITLEQIEYMVEKFQSYKAIKHAIEEENYTYFLAYEKNCLIGYCGVKLEEERLFLSKLYLQKESRGKGLSSAMLKQAIAFAEEHHKKAIYLTCNKYNTHSLDVYKAKNFYVVDSVESDIGNGFIMDDYILQLDL